METEWLVFAIVLLASFVQSLAGFGSALVAVPLLVQTIGLRAAAPTFSLVVLIAEVVMIIRYRHAFKLEAVWRLILTTLMAIPLGIAGARYVDEAFMNALLGVVIIAYALYALSGFRVPQFNKRWGYVFGFLSGLLSGAYATGGPPYIIYGTSQRWPPNEFKVNLQTMFLCSSIAVIFGNAIDGRLTLEVVRYAVFAMPAALVALFVGFKLERRISPAQFRVGVLALLMIIGASLLI